MAPRDNFLDKVFFAQFESVVFFRIAVKIFEYHKLNYFSTLKQTDFSLEWSVFADSVEAVNNVKFAPEILKMNFFFVYFAATLKCCPSTRVILFCQSEESVRKF